MDELNSEGNGKCTFVRGLLNTDGAVTLLVFTAGVCGMGF